MDTTTAPPDMLTVALAWCAAGFSVIPTATNGTKATLGTWKTNQEHAADTATVTGWFRNGHPGLGVVCGTVSGNLEMLELEGRAILDGTGERFLAALDECGLGEVKRRVLAGYCEQSPSGGIHILYRVDGAPVAGNAKLAQRPNPAEDGARAYPLIETRGSGGYVVVAPSHGPVHQSGRPWVLVAGAPSTIATISADECAALHSVARSFDEMPAPDPIPDPVAIERGGGRLQPGTDYNERASWDEVLGPAGWVAVTRNAVRTLWRRPGKRLGVSAATGGASGDFLYVWTTSTELPAEVGLSKWRAYALLHHGGDFSAAAKALGVLGYGNPVEQPHRPVFTVLPGGGNALAPVVELVPATTHSRTDDALALALVDAYGSRIRHCVDCGQWVDWSGQRWEHGPAATDTVREHAKTIGRALPDQESADVRHKVHALSAQGTTNMLTQARSDPRVTVRHDQWDADPWALNTPGGVVDLRTGGVRPHDPAERHTRMTTVAPDPDADPRAWLTFLADTFGGRADLIGYVQRLAGYSITGAVADHVLPFCYGSGANGKTVLLEVLGAILGDYALTSPSGFLMARQFPAHETEIARLFGARFVTCSEINEKDKFDEARVKLLTGGDTITARFMRQDHFSFRPSHHLWLMGNYQPSVTAGGPAFWRRLRVIPFDHIVPVEQRDAALAASLIAAHGAAILAWLVSGAVAYIRSGLDEPGDVVTATDHYAHDQDSVARFVEDACRVGGGDAVKLRTGVVRAAYERWCASEALSPVDGPRLTIALKLITGIGAIRSNGARFYTGLSLADTFNGSALNLPGGQE